MIWRCFRWWSTRVKASTNRQILRRGHSKYVAENVQSRVDLIGRNAERRAEADGMFATAQQQQPTMKRGLHQFVAQIVIALTGLRVHHVYGPHQAQPAGVAEHV